MIDTANVGDDVAALRQCVAQCMMADRHRLQRSLGRVRDAGHLAQIADDIERSAARAKERAAFIPTPEFDLALPVSQARDQLAEAIAKHQVVVVCGETGSGKTTQLPKICLSLGRGAFGLIGHTQPRRIAARTVAARIASELNTSLGDLVGYQVRFVDQVSERSLVKVMTDGVLLAELTRDRYLNRYDTIIIDEAHERSLNIDFLLGYLKQLLPKRPDLKVIITSATIDPDRFSKHFDDAPVIEVSGRTFPVETRYRPIADDRESDLNSAIADAVAEAGRINRGDVLVFLPGEREIREASQFLRRKGWTDTDILPLYGRLSLAQQAAIFTPGGRRRVVLATNVAETSVTVPNIRFVVDTGLARISRYSYRAKVQALPVENISQASANQRLGRCGRVAPGICFRLYDEEGFAERAPYTEPEIQRTNLAAVILQMTALRLGRVDDFPFMDPPDRRYVRDGYQLLSEIGALDASERLTPVGRQLARLPLDPRIGRMLIASDEHGCVAEVLTITAALSINDPRERPLESRDNADAAHKVFADKRSDFVAWLELWRFFREQASELGSSKFKALCAERYLNHARLREWADVRRQLKGLLAEMGLRPTDSQASYEQVHRALLAGLVSQIGTRHEKRGYRGPRGSHFHIFPGSGVKADGPAWVMSASLVQTQRLYAHTVGRVEPEWIEDAAGEQVSRQYGDARFQARRGEVVASEQVSFHGLQLVGKRTVAYARIDPAAAREVFIVDALARGRLRRPPAFLRHNLALEASIAELVDKLRRGDLAADESRIIAFYSKRVGADVVGDKSLRKWLAGLDEETREDLKLDRTELLDAVGESDPERDFPSSLSAAGHELPLKYRFEPGHLADGVTVTVPLAILNQLPQEPFDWLVPGLLGERVLATLRGLPKRYRRALVPLPDFARAAVESITADGSSLHRALAAELERMVGVKVPIDEWNDDNLAMHLRMRFELVESDGTVLGAERDLQRLKDRFGDQSSASFTEMLRDGTGVDGAREWVFDELPESVRYNNGGVELLGFPALVDEGDGVGLRIFQDRAAATASHEDGLVRLFCLRGGRQLTTTIKRLPQLTALSLLYATAPDSDDFYCALAARDDLGPAGELRDDMLRWAAAHVLLTEPARLVRDADTFAARADVAIASFGSATQELEAVLVDVVRHYRSFLQVADKVDGPGRIDALGDTRAQVGRLVHRRFLAVTPMPRLGQLPRYLEAAESRLRKLDRDARADSRRLAEVLSVERLAWQAIRGGGPFWRRDDALVELRWAIEDLRVSVFAQELGTRAPISIKRVQRMLDALRA
jgi:ATP-dependent helicase HrpA